MAHPTAWISALLVIPMLASTALAAPSTHTSTRNYYIIGNPGTQAFSDGRGAWTGGISRMDAQNLDSKLDDGNPTTGKVISVSRKFPIGSEVDNGGSDGTQCYNDNVTPPHYATGKLADSLTCNLGIRTSF